MKKSNSRTTKKLDARKIESALDEIRKQNREYIAQGLQRLGGMKRNLIANALLNHAAPDLLAALQRLLRAPDLNLEELEPETIAAIKHAVEIIAQAKGEKSCASAPIRG